MTAIAIKLDGISGAFTRSAAVFAIVWSTTADRVFTGLFFVCHDSSCTALKVERTE